MLGLPISLLQRFLQRCHRRRKRICECVCKFDRTRSPLAMFHAPLHRIGLGRHRRFRCREAFGLRHIDMHLNFARLDQISCCVCALLPSRGFYARSD